MCYPFNAIHHIIRIYLILRDLSFVRQQFGPSSSALLHRSVWQRKEHWRTRDHHLLDHAHLTLGGHSTFTTAPQDNTDPSITPSQSDRSPVSCKSHSAAQSGRRETQSIHFAHHGGVGLAYKAAYLHKEHRGILTKGHHWSLKKSAFGNPMANMTVG